MGNMGSTKPFLGECSSISIPTCFTGDFHDYWKIRMQMIFESHGVEVWNVIKEGPFITTHNVKGVEQLKP